MPKPAIVLDQDQADDLRELIDLTTIMHEWLDHAADHILNDLASYAYPHTFHPRSYAHWLAEDPRQHHRAAPTGHKFLLRPP